MTILWEWFKGQSIAEFGLRNFKIKIPCVLRRAPEMELPDT
jgi:hypothetical protein